MYKAIKIDLMKYVYHSFFCELGKLTLEEIWFLYLVTNQNLLLAVMGNKMRSCDISMDATVVF